MKICALIPAYNEEETIREVIFRLNKIGITPVVVDDSSTDATVQLAKKDGAIVIEHEINKGKGEAIKTGLNYILKNYPGVEHLVLIDADMQYAPEKAVDILKPLQSGEADFVTGHRNWSSVPFRHRLGNFVWRSFFNTLFGTSFRDTNCGFMGLTKNAMEKLKDVLRGGYIIENTMFIEALKNNLKIKQVPIAVRYREKSGIRRGIRMVLGVLTFIVKKGVKYRLGIK